MGGMNKHHVEVTIRFQIGKAHEFLLENRDPGRPTEASFGPRSGIDLSPGIYLSRTIIIASDLPDRSEKN